MSQIRTTSMAKKFPWRAVFRLAMTHGLSPEQAWRMTPGEILSLMPSRSDGADSKMSRARLADLMARYPNEAPAESGAAQ